MIKLVLGLKGMGKTKMLIEQANNAAVDDHGHVICIEKGPKLTLDLNHKVRLIDVENYNIDNFEKMLAFINGILAGDYDVSSIFIDSILKICKDDGEKFEEFMDELAKHDDKNIFVTASAEQLRITERLKKYID